MSPRRGGGAAYGSGSYDSSSYSTNFWLSKSPLGEGRDPGYVKGYIVFAAIFFFGLLGITVFSIFVKRSKNRNHEVIKSVLGKSKWGLAVSFALVYYGINFLNLVMQSANATVVNVYFIILTILSSSTYPADIFLLLTICLLLLHCFSMPSDDPDRNFKRQLYKAHATFCGLLGLLYLAILALQLLRVIRSGGLELGISYAYYNDQVPIVNKLDFAYTTLYFVASVEIFVATIYLNCTTRKRQLPSSLGSLLVGLIGFPLFLRMVFFLSYNAAFEISNPPFVTIGVIMAEYIICGLAHLLVYAGVVAVSRQLAIETNKRWQTDQAVQQAAATGPGSGLQYPPQYAPPQYDPWSKHPQQISYYQNPPTHQQYSQDPEQQMQPPQNPISQPSYPQQQAYHQIPQSQSPPQPAQQQCPQYPPQQIPAPYGSPPQSPHQQQYYQDYPSQQYPPQAELHSQPKSHQLP